MKPSESFDSDNSQTEHSPYSRRWTKQVSSAENLEPSPFEPKYVLKYISVFLLLHASALYGFYLMFTSAKWKTVGFGLELNFFFMPFSMILLIFWILGVWHQPRHNVSIVVSCSEIRTNCGFISAIFLHYFGGIGITAGAHRLWSHRSFKAKTPLKILLMIMNCVAVQYDVIEWSRDHRVHHKFSETDGDPHNAKRGMFFSHVGWLLQKTHPEVTKHRKMVDVSDLESDPVLAFQKRFYTPLVILLSIFLPTILPVGIWKESWTNSFFVAVMLRYVFTLNSTWTVNSLAHKYGSRPYEKAINPRQNFTSIWLTLGEGWHNYHHTFPYDYRASEFPWLVNMTTIIIDFFAAIGWAYDRKTVSSGAIERRRQRCGELLDK